MPKDKDKKEKYDKFVNTLENIRGSGGSVDPKKAADIAAAFGIKPKEKEEDDEDDDK